MEDDQLRSSIGLLRGVVQVEEAVSVAVSAVEAAEAGQEAGKARSEVRTLDQQEQLLVSLWRNLQPLFDHTAQLGEAHPLRPQPLYLEKTKCQAQVKVSVSPIVTLSISGRYFSDLCLSMIRGTLLG